ncbi:uncharacterized protein LOC122291157 [Carya illinoinensis]|uniref:uncharacterized protein LOC122291157 n=1 Tax=Carya illinoinensis TaxID=32201 RepID=UPI001C71F153|nr:uncharacterized protein LOC122291157 [Carya illinoinensis]
MHMTWALTLKELVLVNVQIDNLRKKFWEGIWRLNVPNLTKQFILKALKNILPTNYNLVKRKVREDAICQICCMNEETICHVPWSCPTASDVWAESKSGLQKWICDEKDFFHVWSDMHTRLQKSRDEEFAMILRGLWTRRNIRVFEGKFDSPSRVIIGAISSLRSFQASRTKMYQTKGSNTKRRKDTKWKPPDEGVSKVNFDAAIDKAKNRLGLGIVARNHMGEVLFSLSASKMFGGTSEMAEAAILWRAIELVVELDVRNVEFEGDAERVIKAVIEKGDTCAWMEQFFDDMQCRLLHRPDWFVKF